MHHALIVEEKRHLVLAGTQCDAEGKLHSVLVIKDGKTGKMFKTEVAAFIEKFLNYLESFGDLPDEEKPDILISCRVSKKGNKYANFDLVEKE